jgi:hypothetical protein
MFTSILLLAYVSGVADKLPPMAYADLEFMLARTPLLLQSLVTAAQNTCVRVCPIIPTGYLRTFLMRRGPQAAGGYHPEPV